MSALTCHDVTKSYAYFLAQRLLQNLEFSGTLRGALLEDNGRWLATTIIISSVCSSN